MLDTIAFLPRLVQDRSEPDGLERMLGELAGALRAPSAGVRVPLEGGRLLVASGGSRGPQFDPRSEPRFDAEHALRAVIPVPNAEPGELWVEPREGGWPTDGPTVAATVGRLLAASPLLARRLAPAHDPARLHQRIQDAAVICGRMAHDFDNILTGIMGFTDLTLPQVPAGSQAATFLGEVGKASQRGVRFTQQLHQLSRAGQGRPQPGSIRAALLREEVRLKPLLKAGQALRLEVPADLPPVAADVSVIQMVLGHLLDNALESMAGAGEVRVTAEARTPDAAEAAGYYGRVAPGPAVAVEVADAGTGIKPEHRPRLFAEPFFTTKVRHRGLGLAIVFRALHAHGGGVRLDPNPPSGTVARVLIPLAPGRLSSADTLSTGTAR